MKTSKGDKSGLETFLKSGTKTPLGAFMSIALNCLVLSLAIDLYRGTYGMSRLCGVTATVFAMDLVPSLVAAVERWHGDGKG